MREVEIRLRRLERILEISRELTSTVSLENLLHQIIEAAGELTETEAASILLLDENTGDLRFVAATDFADQLFEIPVPVEGSIAGTAFSSGEPVSVSDAQKDPRYYPVVEERTGFIARSLLAVPLQFRDRRIGVLEVENKRTGQFDQDDVETLSALAAQATIAIENARLVEALQAARDELEHRVEERTAELTAANRALHREVMDRKLIETMLRESTERFRQIVENAPFGYYRVGRDGAWQYVNPEWVRMHGYELHEVIGRSFEVTQPVEARDEARKIVRRALAGESLSGEFGRRRKDGTIEYHAFNVQPVYLHDEIVAIEGFINDITERKQAEQALQERAAAAERERLAGDLHDAVTQTLFSASLIAEVLPRLWEMDPAEAEHSLRKLHRLTRGALAEMRTLLMELRPSALTQRPLGDLLRHLGEALSNRTKIPVSVHTEGECTPPPDVQIALYRIAQETFNNIAKHAEASQVALNLRCQPSHIEMCISDDGQGFAPEAIPPGHLGLDIMHERAEKVGAMLAIESKAEQGTEIRVTWKRPAELRERMI